MFDNVESHSLGKWSALSDSDNITDFNVTEAWGKMDGHVLKEQVRIGIRLLMVSTMAQTIAHKC